MKRIPKPTEWASTETSVAKVTIQNLKQFKKAILGAQSDRASLDRKPLNRLVDDYLRHSPEASAIEVWDGLIDRTETRMEREGDPWIDVKIAEKHKELVYTWYTPGNASRGTSIDRKSFGELVSRRRRKLK